MAAAAVLFAVAGVLAIAQPGNLSDDTAAPAVSTTTSTTTMSTTSTAPVVTTTSTSVVGGPTTTTVAGSGLNTPGQPSGGSDGTSETGGESWLGVGLVLLAVGMALRKVARPAVA